MQTKVKLITCNREKLDDLTHTIHVVVAKFKTPTLLALDKNTLWEVCPSLKIALACDNL